MNTPTITPVVVGLGQAVHIADGKGTLCRPKALNVAVVEHEQVTCKHCLKAVATTSAAETPAPAASSKKVKRAGRATPAGSGRGTTRGSPVNSSAQWSPVSSRWATRWNRPGQPACAPRSLAAWSAPHRKEQQREDPQTQ